MLLDKLDNYISEVEKHDKVWTGITISGITIEEVMRMSKKDRDQIIDLLDKDMVNELKKLEEGGLI